MYGLDTDFGLKCNMPALMQVALLFLFSFLLRMLLRVESQQFSTLLWSLRKHQNLLLWQGKNETVAQTTDKAQHLMEDWNMANTHVVKALDNITDVHMSSTCVHINITNAHSSNTDAHNNNIDAHVVVARSTSSVSTLIGHRWHPGMFPFSWQRPHRGKVRCNMDASFSVEMNITGIEMCIHDEDDTFVLAKCIPLPILHTDNVA